MPSGRRSVLARWAPVVCIALTAAPAGRAEQSSSLRWDDDVIESIDRIFDPWERPATPGGAVGVLLGGEVVYAKGFGRANLDDDVSITSRTVFELASTAKQFTAAGVALLIDEGTFGRDDDVGTLIPELKTRGHSVRLRHLIHHTSGLPDYFSLMGLAGHTRKAVMSKGELIELMNAPEAANFAPGEEFLYVNSNYLLLALLIERASGRSLGEHLRARLFEPLGMSSTFAYDDPTRIVRHRAIGYRPRADSFVIDHVFSWSHPGDSLIYSSVDDMMRWAAALAADEVIRPGIRDLLLETDRTNGGANLDYAFGLRVSEGPLGRRVWHRGEWAGFRSIFVAYLDAGLALVILSNRADADVLDLAQRMLAAIAPEAEAIRDAEPERVDAFRDGESSASPAVLERFAGRFRHDRLCVEYEFQIRGDGMVAIVPYGGRLVELPVRWRTADQLATPFWSASLAPDSNEDSEDRALFVHHDRVRRLRFERVR